MGWIQWFRITSNPSRFEVWKIQSLGTAICQVKDNEIFSYFPPKLEPLHVRHDMLLAFPCLQSGKCREDWFDQTKAKINWTKNVSTPWKFPYFCLHCPRNPMHQDQPPQFSSPCHCPARQNFLSEILQYFKRNSIKDLSRNEEIMNNNRRENFWFRVKIAETEKSIFLTTDRYFRLWKKGMQWRC